MAPPGGLQSVREGLLLALYRNIIDDYEFALLYDANFYREVFPYWKYDRFNIDNWMTLNAELT